MNDLEEIDPELIHSLNWMLGNDVTELEHTFTYELKVFNVNVLQELTEDGINKKINESNKHEFVKKLCQAKSFKEVEAQVKAFKKGFFEIIPADIVDLFSSGELGILICGKSEIEVEELKKYAGYRSINKDSPQVKWFWEIVEAMDQNMLAKLLFFITGEKFFVLGAQKNIGTPRQPHGGFRTSPIILMRGPQTAQSLPIAHTWY